MKRVWIAAIWAVVVLAACGGAAEAATFYVDPVNGSSTGDGSAAKPWRTLEEVFSQNRIESRYADGSVRNNGAPVQAGDTIVLRSGYHGDISVSSYYNTGLITVIAEEGHRPTLRRLSVSGFKNWRFSGLEISTELSPTFAKLTLVSIGGTSSYVTVDNCLVYCVADVAGFTAQQWLDKTSNGISVGVDCRNVQIIDNVVRNTAFAINLSGIDLLVRGNQIINYRGDGVRALNDNQTVEYNVIKNCYKVDANHDDGIQVFKHNVSQGLIRNMVLRGNTILDHEDFSQPLASSPQGIGIFEGPHENFRIENNLVVTNHWHGITLYWGQGCTIINNTVVNPKYISGASNMNTWIEIGRAKSIYGGENSTDCRIANNMAHSFRTAGNTNLTFENNLTVTRTNYTGIFSNFAAGDYTLKADSPAIDAGSSTDAPPLDILKNPRPTGERWDIGCYEVVGPDATPLAVTGWQQVSSHGSAGTISSELAAGAVVGGAEGLRSVRVLFNRPVDGESVAAAGAVTIAGESGGDVAGLLSGFAVSESGEAVTINFSSALPDGDRYTFTVTTAVLAADGSALEVAASRSVGVLAGDVDGSGEVTAADVLAVRPAVGQAVTAENARLDVTGTGIVTGDDMRAVRGRLGRKLP